MKRKIYLETTQIDSSKTVGEIQKVLGEHGAQKIMLDYEMGEISGLSFLITINKLDIPFKLPCRWQSVFKVLQEERRRLSARMKNHDKDMQQAKRIAWRQILYWVKAQLALVKIGMVKIPEVFMPYIVDNKGNTLYERLESQKFRMLEYKEK